MLHKTDLILCRGILLFFCVSFDNNWFFFSKSSNAGSCLMLDWSSTSVLLMTLIFAVQIAETKNSLFIYYLSIGSQLCVQLFWGYFAWFSLLFYVEIKFFFIFLRWSCSFDCRFDYYLRKSYSRYTKFLRAEEEDKWMKE